MDSPDRLFIVHHCLIDRHSHAYGQARGWLDACRSRGIKPRLYVNRHAEPDIVAEYSALPAFEYPTDVILDPDAMTRDLSDFLTVAERFSRDCSALDRDGIDGSDMMIVTFASERDILGAARWLERISPERRPAVAFLFLSPDFGWGVDPQRDLITGDFSRARYAMRRLRAVLPIQKIVVLATTERLAALLQNILQHPCDACALPKYFVDSDVLAATDAQVDGRATVFVAGEFRQEKGADLTVPVILRLASERPGLRFAVQVPDEKVARVVREQLAPMANSRSHCRIDYGQLSHEVYQKRLLLSDILLLPYLWWRYALRASGVFAEAVGFGIVTVVPDRTWMADMLAAGWGAGTVFGEPTVENIVAAVKAALDGYPTLKERAGNRSTEWRRINSADTVLDLMLRRADAC